MGKLKNVIIYGLLILLCIAGAAGYFVSNFKNKDTKAVEAKPASEQNDKAENESAVADKVEAAANEEAVAKKVKIELQQGKSEAEKQKRIEELMKKAMEMPDKNPVIGIGQGEDHAQTTQKAVENAGGLKEIIKQGDVVIIKPNICTYAEAGSPKITDYRVVQKVAEMAKENGASRIIVAEGTISGNAFDSTYLSINKYDAIPGVELFDMNDLDKEDCYELKPQKSITDKALFIPKVYMDADVVINVAKLKTHFQPDAVVSLTLKNSYGVPPGKIYGTAYKGGLHALGLKESIIDLNRIRRPEFSVIEGIVGGEGEGPLNNTPVKSNIIFAGKDLVALDTVALTFMDFKVEEVPHVKLAADEKLGVADLKNIKVNGADLKAIKMDFESSFKLMRDLQ